MGIPNSCLSDVFHDTAQLPISREQWACELLEYVGERFQDCEPLPGAIQLVLNLSRAFSASEGKIQLALASSTRSDTYELKTSGPDTKRLLSFFGERRILGDDPRVRPGRGKPAPDIYLLALEALNSATSSGERAIQPSECLVFEDSVAGVEAGRRAGMRVIWVPHADVAALYPAGRHQDVLAGLSGEFAVGDSWQTRGVDGWAESLPSLEHFDYKQYGIVVPCSEPSDSGTGEGF